MIFADKLILLRKKAGWSQEELADQMNVTRTVCFKMGRSAICSRPRKNATPFRTVRSKHRLFTERRN